MNTWMIGKNSMKHHYKIKNDFYSHLNMEDSTNVDKAHVKRVCKYFEIKGLGEYHDLYVQSNKLLLADVFQKFKNMCFKMYKLDPAKKIFISRISKAKSFKKDQSKIRLFLTDIDMLLMIGKGIRGGICHSIY